MKNKNKYKRIDALEIEFREKLLAEFRLIAQGCHSKNGLNSKYIFRRLFPNAVTQIYDAYSEWMLKTENEILCLRKSLNDESSEVLNIVKKFEELYKSHEHIHGNNWAYVAREILKKIQ